MPARWALLNERKAEAVRLLPQTAPPEYTARFPPAPPAPDELAVAEHGRKNRNSSTLSASGGRKRLCAPIMGFSIRGNLKRDSSLFQALTQDSGVPACPLPLGGKREELWPPSLIETLASWRAKNLSSDNKRSITIFNNFPKNLNKYRSQKYEKEAKPG